MKTRLYLSIWSRLHQVSYWLHLPVKKNVAALLVSMFALSSTIAQPSATTQPSDFQAICQPNANSVITQSQGFVVANGSCGSEGSISFTWEYLDGATWTTVSNNTPVGFLSYTPVSTITGSGSNVVGTSVLSIIVGPTANSGTYQFRSIATHSDCPSNPIISNTVSFTINPRPSPTFIVQAGAAGCTNTSFTYATESDNSEYVWTVPGTLDTDYTIVSGGTGSTSNTVTLQWLTAGNKTVSVNYQNENGCSSLAAAITSSTVNALPLATFVNAAPLTLCSGTEITYATEDGQNNYQWTLSGIPGTDYNISSGSIGNASNTVSLTWLSAGSKTVTVNYTNTNGCSSGFPASSTTTINSLPVAVAGEALVTCSNSSGINITSGASASHYSSVLWTTNGTGILANAGSLTLATYTPGAGESGIITFTLTAMGNAPCTNAVSTKSMTITALPVATFGYPASPYCNNVGNQLPVFQGGAYAGTFSSTTGLVLVSASTGQVNIAASTPGTYTITNTIAAANGCEAVQANADITITKLPVATFSYPGTPYCVSAPVSLPIFASGAEPGLFSSASGLAFTDVATGAINPGASNPGTYTITNTIAAANGCGAVTATSMVHIIPDATISLTSAVSTIAQAVCIGNPIANIAYVIAGGGTGAVFSGLPPGVSGSFNAGVATISGTPASAGTFEFTVTTTGTCLQRIANGTIDVNATSLGGVVSANQIICSGTSPASLVLSSHLGTVIKWQKASEPTFTMASPIDINVQSTVLNSSTIGVLTTTAYFRAVVQNGSCAPVYSSIAIIAVNPPFYPVITASPAATICLGQPVTLSTGGFSTNDTLIGGDFSQANPPGWSGDNANNSNGANNSDWGEATGGKQFNGDTYRSGAPGGGKFMIVNGLTNNAATKISMLSTPVFSTVGRTSLAVEWYQGYNLNTTAVGRVQISIDGGVTYATLAEYNSSSPVISTNPFNTKVSIDLNAYLGQTNVKIRFYYIGSAGSNWAVDNVNLVGNYQPVTYTWPSGFTVSGQTGTIIPSVAGDNVYTIYASTGGCAPTATTITVKTVPPAVITVTPAANKLSCAGAAETFSSTVSGADSLRWQLSTDNGATYTNITSSTAGGIYSGYTTANLSISATALTMSNYKYRILAYKLPCSVTTSSPSTLKISQVWTGAVSIDWNDGNNWSDGAVPTNSCPDVTIPAGTPFSPVLSSGKAILTNLLIKPGALLTVTGATMQIAGTITSTAGFDASKGTIVFNGSSAQTMGGSQFTANTIMNLTLSNAAGLTVNEGAANQLNITGTLSFSGVNNATLNTGDNLVLISNAAGTARVADITNGGVNSGNKFNGKVTVQRYFPARRAWRLFTAPVSAGGNIFDNWQNGGVYEPGKGTYVSGALATSPTGANGLDWTPLNNSSLKMGVSLSPVLNTHTTGLSRNLADTSDNIPYFIFVRGDRDPANTIISNSNPTTLSSKGKLQTGRQTFEASSTGLDFSFIGNPYASPVDLAKIGRTNVSNRFWLWDPYLNTEQGGYVVFDDYFNTGVYTTDHATTLTKYLQSGQAFFVRTEVDGPAKVVFQETAKAAATSTVAFRPLGNIAAFRTSLYHLNENDQTVLVDGVLAQFDGRFNRTVDLQDAVKAGNIKENLFLKRDGASLAIERRPLVSGDDTLYLSMTRTNKRAYRFSFEASHLDASLTATLEDSYNGNKTPLSTKGSSNVDFVVDNDPASAAANRFRIVFRQSLPMRTIVKAYQQAENIAVEWKVENEQQIADYEVEKSGDGINFVKVQRVSAKGANSAGTLYTWLDLNPASGENYYRIVYNRSDGTVEYSEPMLVKMEHVPPGIRVYPNPVMNGIISMEFKNMVQGNYQFTLFNNLGQPVLNRTMNHSSVTMMEHLQPDYKLAAGIYQLEIGGPGGGVSRIRVIIK